MGNKTRNTSNLVSDNNIFVDISNDRVGIGSTQPTAKLDVDGGLNVSGISTLADAIRFDSSGDDDAIIDIAGRSGTLFIKAGNVTSGKIKLQGHHAYDNIVCNATGTPGTTELHFADPGATGGKKLETLGYGVSVYGGANVSGILTVGTGTSTIGVESPTFTISNNNATIAGTAGTTGEIKQIGGAPFYYDGTGWREVMLSNAVPVTQVADTDWDVTSFRAPLSNDDSIGLKDIKNNISGVSITNSPSSSGFSAEIVDADAFNNNQGSLSVSDTGGVTQSHLSTNGEWSLVAYPPDNNRNFSGTWTIEGWIKLDSGDRPTNSTSPVAIFSSFNYADNWIDPNYDTAYGSNSPSTNVGLGFTDVNDSRTISLGVRTYNLSGSYVNFCFFNRNRSTASGFRGTPFKQFDSNGNIVSDEHIFPTADLFDSTWHHVMFFRNSATNIITAHLDGQPMGAVPANDAGTILDGKDSNNNNNHLFVLGTSYIFDGNNNHYQGYGKCDYDDVRISSNDRYNIGVTTNTTFTPPSQLPTSGTTTIIYPTPVSKFGELTLGSTPVWTGTSGVTPSRVGVGTYRLNYATSYSNKTDYIVTTDIMDSTASEVTVGIARSTDHVEFTLKDSSSTFVDDGSLSVSINNKNNYS